MCAKLLWIEDMIRKCHKKKLIIEFKPAQMAHMNWYRRIWVATFKIRGAQFFLKLENAAATYADFAFWFSLDRAGTSGIDSSDSELKRFTVNPKLLHPSYQHRTFGMKTHRWILQSTILVYIPYSNANFTLSLILQLSVNIVWSRFRVPSILMASSCAGASDTEIMGKWWSVDLCANNLFDNTSINSIRLFRGLVQIQTAIAEFEPPPTRLKVPISS